MPLETCTRADQASLPALRPPLWQHARGFAGLPGVEFRAEANGRSWVPVRSSRPTSADRNGRRGDVR